MEAFYLSRVIKNDDGCCTINHQNQEKSDAANNATLTLSGGRAQKESGRC
jgi:hypothetical protein